MTSATRRQFLEWTTATGAALVAGGAIDAVEPIRRTGVAHLKLSLAAYSFHRFMNLRGKSKPTMTLEDFVSFAVEHNLDAIEPTSYYFADTSDTYLAKFRSLCTRQGLDISGTAIGNDFCKKDSAQRDKELAAAKQWIDRAAILGAKTIRIFAGTLPKGDTEEAARSRCIEAILQACDHASKFGILIALENHGGITATPEQMLAIIRSINHPSFGVNLDTGNFHTKDPYADLSKIAPYAVVVQLKTEIQRQGGSKEEADLRKLVAMLRKVNYRGYVALEYEAATDPTIGVPKALAELRQLIKS